MNLDRDISNLKHNEGKKLEYLNFAFRWVNSDLDPASFDIFYKFANYGVYDIYVGYNHDLKNNKYIFRQRK